MNADRSSAGTATRLTVCERTRSRDGVLLGALALPPLGFQVGASSVNGRVQTDVMDRDHLRVLRGAIYRHDGAGVMASLGDVVPEAVLQLAGDGLLVAVAQSVEGADKLASECASALRDRGFVGDEELAIELEAAVRVGEASALVPVPVDPEELAELLEEDLGSDGGRLDLRTGEVWSASVIENSADAGLSVPDFDDATRWRYVPPEGSEEGYRDMQAFIAGLVDPDRADRLLLAIDGRGAFRRFKQTLARWPEEEHRWYRFSDERQRGRARAWLADAGYRPAVSTGADLPE